MCRLVLMTISCLLVFFGISGLWMMPKLVQQKIEQRMQLKIGTKNFERFTKIPIPITVKFYLFNVTNSEKVLQALERPQFQEVGPFVFKQWRRREIVDILDHNRKIVYREFKTFYPVLPTRDELEAASEAHNNDTTTTTKTPLDPRNYNVTIVNLPLLSVLTQLGQLEEGSFKRQLAAKVVSRLIQQGQERILITKPVNQLLFDGYKVGLMESANDLIGNTLGFNFESPLPKNKFGFFYGKNGTWTRREGGELTVFTGRNESMDDFMLVDNWNGLKQLRVWPNSTEAGNRCNEIRGTDGSQFHPGVTRDQVLNIFSPLVCTSIFIKFKEDTSTRGIPLLRFTTPSDVFAAPKKSPRNACYCTIQSKSADLNQQQFGNHKSHLLNSGPPAAALQQAQPSTSGGGGQKAAKITNGRCYIDGLMDLSLCQRGAPIAASSPHFYNADPMLAMAAGLKPQQQLHETHIDIEPMTGAVFRAASRAQLNAFVEQAALDVVDTQLIGHMSPMVAPLLWLEETAEIDEKSSLEFKGQLLNLVDKVRRSCYYAIALGLLVALLTSLHFWYYTCYKIDKKLQKRTGINNDDGDEHEQDEQLRRRRKRLEAMEDRRGGSRPKSSQRQYERNLRLGAAGAGGTGADAQRSNLAARQQSGAGSKKPLIEPLLLESDSQQMEMDERRRGPAKKGNNSGVLVATSLVAAAELRRVERQRRRNRRADYELDDEADQNHQDEDELSRRNLVENEWLAAAASTSRSETSQSTDGRDSSQIIDGVDQQQAAPPDQAGK